MVTPALDVYLNGERAGALRRKHNGNLQFRYDGDYVEAKKPPLSLNLPLRTEAYPHRACLAFFGNLLPEEDVRAQVALATGISAANDYRLLERFAGDIAGAITLLPSDQASRGPEPDSLEPLSAKRLDEVLTELPQRPLAVDEKGEVRMSLAGAQSKLPVVETGEGFALPHGSGHPTTHILSPSPHASPVQEDICQALGKLYVEKYQHEGGPGVRESMELIDRTAIPARDREQFWMALVFNVLIGNCDAHGKNYSLLYYSPAPSLGSAGKRSRLCPSLPSSAHGALRRPRPRSRRDSLDRARPRRSARARDCQRDPSEIGALPG